MEWPENHCPECARTLEGRVEDDKLRIDGEIIRGTFATCAAQVKLSPLRYLWYKDEARMVLNVWLFLVAAAAISLVMRWWALAGLALIFSFVVGYILWWICRQVAVIFLNALLTPGMVVSRAPLEFISLANMDTGFGEVALAVKRVGISRLPDHSSEVGTQFPCVSGFQDGSTLERWGDFDPQPLVFGTGSADLIQARRAKLGEEAFAQLQSAYEKGKYPEKAGELLWLTEPGAAKTPPPLPHRATPPPLPRRP